MDLNKFPAMCRVNLWDHAKQINYLDDYMAGLSRKHLAEKYDAPLHASNLLLSHPKFKHLKSDIMAIRKEVLESKAEDYITDEKLKQSSALSLSRILERYFKMGRLLKGENAEIDPISIDVDDLVRRLQPKEEQVYI